MRFTLARLGGASYKTYFLKNELLKPLWEYSPGQIAGKPTSMQGAPEGYMYEKTFGSYIPRLAPHLDPSCSLSGTPRDIEDVAWVGSKKYSPVGSVDGDRVRDIHADLERFRGRYFIQLQRRRCGGSPMTNQNRDVFDIILKDSRARHPAHSFHSKEKEDIELLGQYDGQPNKFNEKILSLDVEKILYYIGLGVSLGQDVAELLGVCGLLPVHPQTTLRLKKLHETRKNMEHENAGTLFGHDNALDAVLYTLHMTDKKQRIKDVGLDTFFDGEEEWTKHEEKLAVIKQERKERFEEYEAKIKSEQEKVEIARQKYYAAINKAAST